MDVIATFFPRILAWALIASRLAGFVAVSPFPGNNAPVAQRAALVATLSFFVTSLAPVDHVPKEMDFHLIASAVTELLAGLCMGFAFRLVMSSSDVLGAMISQACGLSTPSVLNPATEAHETPLSKAFSLLGILLAVGMGAHRTALVYLIDSFQALPVGSDMFVAASAPRLCDIAFDAVAVGVRLAMPALGIYLLSQLALAMVARAAPQLQIFNIGLTVTLGAGFVMLMASLGSVSRGLMEYLATLGPRMDSVLSVLAGGGG
jgi:flagellar biosynthetic protein FliR